LSIDSIAEPIVAIWSTAFAILGAAGFTVKGKIIMSIFEALFTITVYTVVAFTSVGIPLMAQVALSILKPAGSVGVIVQLVSTLLELLKVILVMAEPVMAT
jgi:hypothetical protein